MYCIIKIYSLIVIIILIYCPIGHSSGGQRFVQYSRPPSSDGSLENSVYSYYGDNYVIPPDRRKSRSLTVDTQASIDESPPRRFHRPLFISLVTLAHVGVLLYICIAGGVEKIGFKSTLEHLSINTFGYIGSHEINYSVHKQKISRYTGVNIFIGPNSSFLVHAGAKFVPVSLKCLLHGHILVLYKLLTKLEVKVAGY